MRETNIAHWLVLLGIILVLGSNVTVTDLFDNHTGSIVVIPEPNGFPAGSPHAPIVIDGDDNFNSTAQAEGWPGNGTSVNPYIIEGLDIDLGGSPGHGISISNTQAHFIVRNCILSGANDSMFQGSGVHLNNVTNGALFNNTCTNNYAGVFLDFSLLNEVDNNTFTNSIVGIYIQFSDSNTLSNNTSNASQIGLFSQDSSSNTIEYNNFNDNIYSIRLEGSHFNTMMNNTCNNNSHSGVNFQGSHSNTMINNTFNNNDQYGIYLQFSDSNTVMNNTCNSNSYGITLEGSSDLNDIQWNVFLWNTANHATDGGSANVFDYNFWSDYAGYDADGNGIGDTPYYFPGNQDPHPLIALPDSPLFWLELPADQVIVLGEPLRYDLNASIYGGIDRWWVNDTLNFVIDQSGVLTNITFLLPEKYGLQVSVNDSEGKVLSDTFTIIVEDWSPPKWSEVPVNQLIECGVIVGYYLNATDVSGLDTWWMNDTVHFAIGSDGKVTSIGILPVGVYGVQVWVNDTWGNTLTGFFAITVVDTLAPTWDEPPQNQTIEYGATYVYDFDATDPSGIGEWWVDDTIHFVIDWLGQIRTVGILEPDTYGVRVYVSDIHGNSLSVSITVEVIATTTTTPTTNTSVQGIDPVMTLVLGVGIGVGATIILFTVLLKKNVRMIRK